MNLANNYKEMILEIKAWIDSGELSLSTIIQVVRQNGVLPNDSYCPIIDFYLSDKKVGQLFNHDPLDNENDRVEKEQLRLLYEKDKRMGRLEIMTVSAYLIELEEVSKLL